MLKASRSVLPSETRSPSLETLTDGQKNKVLPSGKLTSLLKQVSSRRHKYDEDGGVKKTECFVSQSLHKFGELVSTVSSWPREVAAVENHSYGFVLAHISPASFSLLSLLPSKKGRAWVGGG